MINNTNEHSLIIAGPCALESRQQLRRCISALKAHGVKHVRASLWKPRTLPGWEGLGAMGLSILLEETLRHGIVPATEIITPQHAHLVIEAARVYGEDTQMIVWLGARNQNHLYQQSIASILASGPKGIKLMFKNQIWQDYRHWKGIYEHLVTAGFPKDRLLACHRGFAAGPNGNTGGLRNIPDYAMAMRLKEETGCPVLLDPSHIGGSRDKVMEIVEEASDYQFDGLLIEVHCDPDKALTDAKQQLTPDQFGGVLERMTAGARGVV